ncbi:TPA: MAE_28990/MAE_18760 family HEPN-like nuclease [Providencia alcalifaciens]
MYSINQDMNTRFDEINGMIDFIKNMELDMTPTSQKLNLTVLKSSVIIMLYNVVESTISRVLCKIHQEIINENVKYYQLSKNIRSLMILYYHKNREKNSDIHNSMDTIHDTIDFINEVNSFNLNYQKMEKFYSLYSGNLDAKKVRTVFSKYDISIDTLIGEKLHEIKNGRNKLAHGEVSFEEYGRNIVVKMLESYSSNVDIFLKKVISLADDFLIEKKYMSTHLI